MVSQNPEFVSAVTDMVKNSRIELTIMDTKTVNVEEENIVLQEILKQLMKQRDRE